MSEIADLISQHFLGTKQISDSANLKKRYELLRKELIELRQKIINYEAIRDLSFTHEDIKDLRTALPNLTLINSEGITAEIVNTAVSFHLRRDADDVNGNYVYTTHPYYYFTASIVSPKVIHQYNKTMSRSSPNQFNYNHEQSLFTYNDTSRMPLHPHATPTNESRMDSPFRSVCTGSNGYMHLINNAKTPSDIKRMFSMLHEWYRSANLSDMFGNNLNYSIILGNSFQTASAREFSEKAFKFVQEHARAEYNWLCSYTDSPFNVFTRSENFLEKLVEMYLQSSLYTDQPVGIMAFLDNHWDRGATVASIKQSILYVYTFIYALWLVNHSRVLVGSLSKGCMYNALCWDLVHPYFHRSSCAPSLLNTAMLWELDRIAPLVFSGPFNLKKYASEYGDVPTNILEQIID